MGSPKIDTPHLILQTGCLGPREVLWCGGPSGLGFRSQPYGFGEPSTPFFFFFLNHFSFHLFFIEVFIELVTILLLFSFMFWLFSYKACGILAPRLGIKLASPALEGSLNQWTARKVPFSF